MICDAFFYKLCQNYFISTPWSDLLAIVTTELLQLWWLSQVVGPGFEPGLVLEFFCFPATRLLQKKVWKRRGSNLSFSILFLQ